ncbi:hypothetical protein KUCAC02_014512 [Chaenocephalus aceratus]|uniref:Uncharacterized protein n=1 Tax=Chaenocephalus aceratus TaxID=36190 RepID=A0ACB9WFK6_CHAAC|nr:hypothetical protein KUCAC02_014512 [Chaenocephalus aceratus]
MSSADTAWNERRSVLALGREHCLDRKEHDTTDTAQSLSTSGYLIISIATCSLMTPITCLAHSKCGLIFSAPHGAASVHVRDQRETAKTIYSVQQV